MHSATKAQTRRPVSALSQFRREVVAGLRQANAPVDALFMAAWRELAAGGARLSGRYVRAAELELEAAKIIVAAAQRKAAA